MRKDIKFRFGYDALFGISMNCKKCALAPNFTRMNVCEHPCPIIEHVNRLPYGFTMVVNQAWWASDNSINFGVVIDDLLWRWKAFSKCKKLAGKCQYNNER